MVLENKYYSQDHDETVTSLPNRQCPEQGRFFLIGNICSPGLCPWSYIYIYQDFVLGGTYVYIYIVQDFVLGVMYVCIYIYRPGPCPWSYLCVYSPGLCPWSYVYSYRIIYI